MKRILMPCIIVCMLPSCAYVISRESRALASRDVAFSDLLQGPDTYVNQVFILGGIIAGAAVSRDGTEIEVVQTQGLLIPAFLGLSVLPDNHPFIA